MPSYNLQAAVVGAGFIGPVHVEALRRLGIPIAGVLGCDPDESVRAKRDLGLPKAYSEFRELLDDASVDCVHLAVPNVLHYEMAQQALLAGKHVMCEKPLAMTSAETADLVEIAASRNQAAAVCYNVRFYPLNIETRSMLQSGSMGDVYAVNGSYTQDWLLYETDYNWRVLSEQGGHLRAVADIGTHWMDLITSITGLQIEAVFADLSTVHKTRKRPLGEIETFSGKLESSIETEPVDIQTEDYGCLMFRFAGGAKGSLWVSQVTAGRKNCLRYEIAASEGSLAWDSESPNQLWIGKRNQANESLIRDPSLVSEQPKTYRNYPGGHNEGFPDTFKQCFRAFYDYIAKGDFDADPHFPTFESGHMEVVLCEAVLRSHEEQRWVMIEEF
jgi:predicted dehydrogenase